MSKKETLMSDEAARKVLNIDEHKWIVAVGDEELAILKAALRLHANLASDLASKIDAIGT